MGGPSGGHGPEAIGFGLTASGALGRYLEGKVLSSTTAGLRLHARFEGREWEFTSPLVGNYNAENLLAVQAVALGFGLDPEAFRCFETFCGVPGRLERILNPQNLDVFVDYAHTPDALINVLNALRGAGFKRIVTVFGCGATATAPSARSWAKPWLGCPTWPCLPPTIRATRSLRRSWPTSCPASPVPPKCLPIRIAAGPLKRALSSCTRRRPAHRGQGHESTQQIGDVKHPFSDQQTVREILGCA